MPAIEFHHITKRFENVTALEDVSFALSRTGVHGLLGGNGAGKSTIMSILYGLIRPDDGEIRLDGRPVAFRLPRDAISAGIGMVHQHFMLARAMTVLDNVLLGDRQQGRIVDRRSAAGRLVELANRLDLPIDPDARIEELSVGEQQRVEILKALYRDIQVLILDEPTAVLTPQEVDQLLAAMSRLRAEGKSVILISHKLGEVLRICDDVTILRRGKYVWQGAAKETGAEQLAEKMVGENPLEVGALVDKPPVAPDRMSLSSLELQNAKLGEGAILRLENLIANGIENVSASVGAEIVGVAGVDGNGQQELAELIVGLREVKSGRILLNGDDITDSAFQERCRLGVAHIPNDRKREGLVGSMSIVENLVMKHHTRQPFSRNGVMSWRRAREMTALLVEQFDVRCASLDMPASALSGGNQQKLILARELAVFAPKLLVAMNPTRGLDIAATRFVHQQLRKLRADGRAIVIISSELDELMGICDRIAVLYRGRLSMTRFPETNVAEIGRMMAGVGGA